MMDHLRSGPDSLDRLLDAPIVPKSWKVRNVDENRIWLPGGFDLDLSPCPWWCAVQRFEFLFTEVFMLQPQYLVLD